MDTEHVIVALHAGLVVITLYYAYVTHKILKEQRKTAESTVIPVIGFEFNKKRNDFLVRAELNSLFNATAKVFVNGKFKSEQKIGNAILHLGSPSQNTDFFDLSECLKEVEKDKQFDFCIELSYEIRTGSRIVERYIWKPRIDSKGILKISAGYPKKREVISAPWL